MTPYQAADIAAAITCAFLMICALLTNIVEHADIREYVESVIGSCMLLTLLLTLIQLAEWIFG